MNQSRRACRQRSTRRKSGAEHPDPVHAEAPHHGFHSWQPQPQPQPHPAQPLNAFVAYQLLASPLSDPLASVLQPRETGQLDHVPTERTVEPMTERPQPVSVANCLVGNMDKRRRADRTYHFAQGARHVAGFAYRLGLQWFQRQFNRLRAGHPPSDHRASGLPQTVMAKPIAPISAARTRFPFAAPALRS